MCASPKVCVCVQLAMYAIPRYVTIPTPPTHPNPKMCVCVCVQLGMYASPRYVTIPTQPKGMRVCTVGNVCKSKVCYHPHHPQRYVCVYSWECMQVQGMLPSPPHTHPPTPTQRYVCVCVRAVGNVCKSKVCYQPHPTHPPTPTQRHVCVQLGMYASPRYATIPTPHTHPPQPKGMCVCVCACSWECMQVQGMLPSPPHTPTHPNPKVCWECMQVQGMLPSPPHPPTHPNPKVCVCVCVYRWVPKNTLCVQMSQICVRRWGFWSVCTDESNLCAQMSPHPRFDSSKILLVKIQAFTLKTPQTNENKVSSSGYFSNPECLVGTIAQKDYWSFDHFFSSMDWKKLKKYNSLKAIASKQNDLKLYTRSEGIYARNCKMARDIIAYFTKLKVQWSRQHKRCNHTKG